MTSSSFLAATNAYRDALRSAQNILDKTTIGGGNEVAQAKGSSFLDMVGGALQSAQASGYKSEDMAMKALTGKADLSDVVAAVTNAETALNTVVAVRDRVINAYQDIIKMPI